MKTFFENNRQKLDQYLEVGDLALLFNGSAPKSTADAHYAFLTNKNFYYLSGCCEEHFILAVLKTANGLESTLFIEKPDYDIEKWIGRKTTKAAAEEKSGVKAIAYLEEFEGWINRLIYQDKVQRLYLDLEKLNPKEADSTAARYCKQFMERYPFVAIKTLHPILTSLRTIKEPFEIEQIKKAVHMTKEGLEAILCLLKPGVYEYQLESTFAHSIRMNGADGNSFPTIAASGTDAVILHYVENNKPVSSGELVLLDLGAQYQEYAADISRTFPVDGIFTERQKAVYNSVLKAQDAVIEAIKPGTLLEDLNKICQASLTESLKALGVMTEDKDLGLYYYHGVSHHLGLDVHDLGPRTGAIEPGMVLTVEPGLYIEKEGIGIRIEEDVLVTATGNEVLSEGIPRTVDEIEAFMRER
ncbi:aminopeptidase P family protein [Fusibacter sp. JL298sf-3]